MKRGLTATADLWPDVERAYTWVHRAAHILANHDGQAEATIRQTYDELLAEMADHRDEAGSLAPAVTHFLKVTDSYRSGLFHCYTVSGLPRTNNDLEHYFGRGRYLERRTTGRKVASAALVIRGPVRLIASLATHSHPFQPEELGPVDWEKWVALRRSLDAQHAARRAQRRFRRGPHAYLAALENQLLKLALPS